MKIRQIRVGDITLEDIECEADEIGDLAREISNLASIVTEVMRKVGA